MPRPTIRSMVTGDLHYCCLWFFFSRFRKTGMIAARLGVTPQAVRYCRSQAGGCEGKPNCMDKRLTLKLTPRRVRSE